MLGIFSPLFLISNLKEKKQIWGLLNVLNVLSFQLLFDSRCEVNVHLC